MSDENNLTEVEFNTTLVSASIKGTMKSVGAGSRDLWQVEPSKIQVIEGLNPRVMNDAYKAHIRALADSMKSEGYYQDQPLAGYAANVNGEAVICIYSGHTRLMAVVLANSEGAEISRVPVTVSQEGLSMEDITVALIRGNGGKNLTYYESAVVCKRLVKYGFELEEIAVRTGIAVNLVKNRLSLMAAPLKLRELVANETVSATLAIEMISEHGDKALEKIEAARLAASGAGKSRITKLQTVEASIFERAKFVKKAAPKLYEAAGAVRDDPGFSSLSAETRELIESLLAQIRGKDADEKSAAEVDPRQQKIDGVS
jgi:ParB family transcriptional regulator, chromosome partitioning protein